MGVFDRLPTLQIIIGHMGEMIPFMLTRIDDTLMPVAKQLQRPVSEYFLHHFHITTSGFFTHPPLLLAMQVMGADRIMFSVDYPFSTNEQGRAFLDRASLHDVCARAAPAGAPRVVASGGIWRLSACRRSITVPPAVGDQS